MVREAFAESGKRQRRGSG